MDFNAVFVTTPYSYHSYPAEHQYHDRRTMNNEDTVPLIYIPNAIAKHPTLPPMQRFLNEPERTIIMPSIPEAEHHLMHTLPDPSVFPAGHFDTYATCRLPSPTNSGLGSSYVSSEWSERQESPLSSPYASATPYSPGIEYNDAVSYTFGGNPPLLPHDPYFSESCVAMHDVQKCADQPPETFVFDNEPVSYISYGSFAQEGYQPIQSGDETTSGESYSTPGTEYPQQEEAFQEEPMAPVIRRRRPQAARSTSNTSPVSPGRVSKRSSLGRRAASQRSINYIDDDVAVPCASAGNRAFPCPLAIYGCTSTFGSKNEWKRHVSTQHMRLGFWRCDQCIRERKPNDFNRKDLFMQHVRRMHPMDDPKLSTTKKPKIKKESTEEQLLQEAAARCYRPLRSAPEESQCLFCDQHFHGPGSWDDRMEHVGRHMETAKKDHETPADPRHWHNDEQAQNWFLKQRVIRTAGKHLVLAV